MKKIIFTGLIILAAVVSSARAEDTIHKAIDGGSSQSSSGEAWKGPSPTHLWTAGATLGVGIIDGNVGVTFMGNGAIRIVEKGFSPDMNNQVFIETSLGAQAMTGSSPFLYSLHLRWDFIYDEDLTLFGLGGLSGSVATGSFRFFPRFGIGGLKRLTKDLWLRGEVSHEWTAIGVSFNF